MARKQVLVQLDDSLVERLDGAAKEAGMSRSELLRRAADLYLHVRDEIEADRRTVEAYARTPEDPADDAVFARLAALAFAEDEPW